VPIDTILLNAESCCTAKSFTDAVTLLRSAATSGAVPSAVFNVLYAANAVPEVKEPKLSVINVPDESSAVRALFTSVLFCVVVAVLAADNAAAVESFRVAATVCAVSASVMAAAPVLTVVPRLARVARP